MSYWTATAPIDIFEPKISETYELQVFNRQYIVEAKNENEAISIACDLYWEERREIASIEDVIIINSPQVTI